MAVRQTIEITRPSAAISFYSFDDTTEKYIETMWTQKQKQRQKPAQVEFKAEIIAAHCQTTATKRALPEKWLQSFSP